MSGAGAERGCQEGTCDRSHGCRSGCAQFPQASGSAVHRNIKVETKPVKNFEPYFLKLPWLPLSFSFPAVPANPVLQLRVTWGVMHLCFVAPSSDCTVSTGESETCWEQRCLSQFLRDAHLTSLQSAQLLWPSLKWGQWFKLLAASAAMKFKSLVTKWSGHPVFCSGVSSWLKSQSF